MLKKALLSFVLVVLGSQAWADAETEKANAEYAATLQRIQGNAGLFVSPQVQRFIGWPGPSLGGMSAKQQLDLLLQSHWDWQMRTVPEWATYTAFPGQNHRWSDISVEATKVQQELEKATLEVAESISMEDLSAEDQLNLQLFIEDGRGAIAGHAFPHELLPVNQMFGIHTQIPQLLGAMALRSADDVEDYYSRLEKVPALLVQVKALLAQGLAKGVTQPKITIKMVLPQLKGLVPDKASDSALLKPIAGLSEELRKQTDIQARAEALYADKLQAAFLNLHDYIKNEYMPKARVKTAWHDMPDGEAWYAWRVAEMTTTDMTPAQVHQIGLDEVARIKGEMHAIMRELKFKGDIPAFVASLKKDRSHFYTEEADLLRDYRAMGKLADGALVKLFKKFAALPYAIEPIPAYSAAGRAGAYYVRGSAEGARPGVFYVNTSRLPETPKYEMEALLLHEAVPGHHFQLALAQELEGLPQFRLQGGETAYIEGWGLYAESLGEEMGFYQDPYSKFGALTFEIWRAIRLVVDTGMHALGWSRQQAIDYFADNTGRPKNRIVAEVDRYLVMPGQALAYKIGQLKIQELRDRAEEKLGEAFDVRDFHDVVLSAGALPLTILEQRVDTWIADEQENLETATP